jgi:ATP-dependent Clp protease protease subunit
MVLPPHVQDALLGRRVVFVRGQLDAEAANAAIAQLVLLAHMPSAEPIQVYLDSPGGALSATLALYDFLQTVSAPVAITGLGTIGGAAVLILAGGSAGRRFALPHARIQLRAETGDLPPGTVVEDQGAEAMRVHARWREALVRHVGHSAAQVERDLAAGRWLSAAEARDYGLVDGIIPGAPAAMR